MHEHLLRLPWTRIRKAWTEKEDARSHLFLHEWPQRFIDCSNSHYFLRSEGPKDEGLALLKKCEEVSRHLSSRSKEDDDKKRSDSSTRKDGCSTNWGSSAQLSLEQIDGLLGTNLVDYISTLGRYELKSWLVTENPNSDRKRKADAGALSLPSCARSLDDLTLFIYKHGFQDLLFEDALCGHSSDTSRALLARRRKSQEELLKSGALRTIAKLLKRIHDSNFYRSEQDKIANAFSISIQKNRVDREGLSANWEFYGANYHPKIPLKDKNTYVQISHELSRRPTKRPTWLVSNSKRTAHPSVSGRNNQPAIADKSKSIAKPQLASPSKPSKSGSAQCKAIIKGKARKPRLKGKTKGSDLPRIVLWFTATLTTEDENSIKQRPLPSNSEFFSGEIDREIKDMGDCTISQLEMTSIAPGSDGHNKARSGQRAGSTKIGRSTFMLRDIADDLPSYMTPCFRAHSLKSEPDEGLSILARIDQLFPSSHSEEDLHRGAELQVEIERLKILRW